MNLNIFETTIVASIIFLNLYIAFRVFLADRTKRKNIAFAGFVLFISAWIAFAYYSEFFPTGYIDLAILLSKLALASSLFFVTYLFLFSLSYTSIDDKIIRKLWLYTRLIGLLFVIAIVITPLFIIDIKALDFSFNIIYGILYTYLFLPYTLALAGWSFYNFIRSYKLVDKDEKKQLQFFFVGVAILFALGIFFALIVPVFTGTQAYYRIGNYSTIVLTVTTAFAIMRTNFINRRVLRTEFMVLLILLGLFIDTALSKTPSEFGLKMILLVATMYLGYTLIKMIRADQAKTEKIDKLNDSLSGANARLKELDFAKTEFISIASHELLTPISAIEGYLSMIVDEKLVKFTDPKAEIYINRVYSSSKRLARLVTDLLNVSRIEQGRMLVQKEDCNLEEILNSVVGELKFKSKDAKIKIEVEYDSHLGKKMYLDSDKIKEIVVNLLGNTIKYTPKGGEVKVWVEKWPTEKVLRSYDNMNNMARDGRSLPHGTLPGIANENFRRLIGSEQYVVIVKDTGIGIEKKDLAKLFQKFSRVGDWSTSGVPGSGLGLYISKALVETHHGKIWAQSEGKNKGSTFYFSLPEPSSTAEIKKLDELVPEPKDAKPLTVFKDEKLIKSDNKEANDGKKDSHS